MFPDLIGTNISSIAAFGVTASVGCDWQADMESLTQHTQRPKCPSAQWDTTETTDIKSPTFNQIIVISNKMSAMQWVSSLYVSLLLIVFIFVLFVPLRSNWQGTCIRLALGMICHAIAYYLTNKYSRLTRHREVDAGNNSNNNDNNKKSQTTYDKRWRRQPTRKANFNSKKLKKKTVASPLHSTTFIYLYIYNIIGTIRPIMDEVALRSKRNGFGPKCAHYHEIYSAQLDDTIR